jgi:predicted Zn-dependent protease
VAKLLEAGQSGEAERLLLGLMKQPPHERNDYLALHASKLLHDHHRSGAVRQLLEKRVETRPRSVHKHNLYGLALLDTDPPQAVVQLQLALRWDLHYGPAYLNLAQAYEKMNRPAEARLCLRRYLRLLPYGPHADDARLRLAALQARLAAGADVAAGGLPGVPGLGPGGPVQR